MLERLGLPLAAVLGTKGVERHAITFHGQEAHSVQLPWLTARTRSQPAAKLALEIRTIASKHTDAVCTMGSVKTSPASLLRSSAAASVPSISATYRPKSSRPMYREAQEASQRFAAEEHCTVDWSRIWSIEPIPFHPELIALAQQSIIDVAGEVVSLPSGPLHDAAEVARLGIPTVMIFVQSLRGISHNKIEDSSEDHLRLAVTAFDRLARKTMDWMTSQETLPRETRADPDGLSPHQSEPPARGYQRFTHRMPPKL